MPKARALLAIAGAAVIGCDAMPTGPTSHAGAPTPQFAILDMTAILADPTVRAAATGHAVRVGFFVCPPKERCEIKDPEKPPINAFQEYSFSAVQHADGRITGEFELAIELA